MTKLTPSLLVASLLALGLSVTPADAQTRVFVGISGNDANPCTVVAPCRTLAAFAVALGALDARARRPCPQCRRKRDG
jgi:hypothetical protein